ncbi:MAG: DUF2269 family protein, partial [Gammaproteobacteria bacterium]
DTLRSTPDTCQGLLIPSIWAYKSLSLILYTVNYPLDQGKSLKNKTDLPQQYHDYAKIWFWLGVPAFFAMSLVIVLMVFKP